MGPLPRLGLFLATLAVVFGGSFALGAALDHDNDDPAPVPSTTIAPTTTSTSTHADHGAPP